MRRFSIASGLGGLARRFGGSGEIAGGAGRPGSALGWYALALLARKECAASPLLLVWLDWRGALRGARKSRGALAAMFALALAAGARVIWATAVIPGAPAGLQAGISPGKYLLV